MRKRSGVRQSLLWRNPSPAPLPTIDTGNDIFLTWSATQKDLPQARRAAAKMRALGTTFRGCSFDVKVSRCEECPVCGCIGLKAVDTPWDYEDRTKAHSADALTRKRKD